MQGVLKKARPSRIEDLIALNALYRPGAMEHIDTFCDCKNGRKPIEYPLPALESVLKETYGVPVYQEQVMQIAQVVAGFSLGQADILRRAMGKKKPEEALKMRPRFLEGASANGVSREGRRAHLRAALRLHRVRLQQEPQRGLRDPRLPHDLAEGEPPRRVHGRQPHQRHQRHRPDRRAHPRGARDGPRGAAARRQPVRPGLRGGGRADRLRPDRASTTSAPARSRRSSPSAPRTVRSRTCSISSSASTRTW